MTYMNFWFQSSFIVDFCISYMRLDINDKQQAL